MDISDSWNDALDQFTNHLVTVGHSVNTLTTRWYQLSKLARALPEGPDSVTEKQLVSWLASQNWNADTRHNTLSGIKVFYQWAKRSGYCKVDPSENLPKVKRPKRVARPVPEDVWLADRKRATYRVKLIIDLAALLGLRRCEIARIHSSGVIQNDGGWMLLVHGKGDEERVLPLSDSLMKRLTAKEGWVFPSYPDSSRHLTPDRIGKMIEKLTGGSWTLHQLRHRFGTIIWQRTHDLLTVQTLLGHESQQTTEICISFPDERLREVLRQATPLTRSVQPTLFD